jgi:hypothetical protein
VRVRAGNLFDTIYDKNSNYSALQAFLGPVEYQGEAAIRDMIRNQGGEMTFDPSGIAQARALMVKRLEFSHEQEVRLLYNLIDVASAREDRIAISIEPTELFEEVVLDPRLPTARAEELTSRLRIAGYSGAIRQSNLYKLPSFPDLEIDY